MESLSATYYQAPRASIWQGRVDGTDQASLRWHQQIHFLDLATIPENLKHAYVLLGFASDEGVRRNQGRVGAFQGPEAIRQILANLPVHHELKLYDAGNVICKDGNLEEAQAQLALAVAMLKQAGAFPILMGGGHEITYGHFCGLAKNATKKIGIINIDAHFDLRKPVDGQPTSGTGLYQIAEDVGTENFHYLALGIQEISNTKALFDQANLFGADYILQSALTSDQLLLNLSKIEAFLAKVDEVYLTIDLDAFASPFAPGVSALAFQGIIPDHSFFKILDVIYRHPKLISMDIAELNPKFDQDNRTAKLAADLIFKKVSFNR